MGSTLILEFCCKETRMKARYHLPPDAYARLRMLSNLSAAREAATLRPAMDSDPRTGNSTVASTETAPRAKMPMPLGN